LFANHLGEQINIKIAGFNFLSCSDRLLFSFFVLFDNKIARGKVCGSLNQGELPRREEGESDCTADIALARVLN
jgi:hypothetical protein